MAQANKEASMPRSQSPLSSLSCIIRLTEDVPSIAIREAISLAAAHHAHLLVTIIAAKASVPFSPIGAGYVVPMVEEINEYIFDEYSHQKAHFGKNAKEDPRRKKDHLIDCLLYKLQIPPRYFKDRWAYYDVEKKQCDDEDDVKKVRRFIVDRITGY
jgi:hypothetical protein